MDIAVYIVCAIFAASVGYVMVASYCVLRFSKRTATNPAADLDAARDTDARRPGVSIYKPLHGMDFELSENLLSFCRQDYPDFEILFGVASDDDPAAAIARDVIAQCPSVDAKLIVDDRVNGANPKVSNLINMDAAASKELLVISDSDMRVGPDYLTRVVQAFNTERVGLVTCLYTGKPAPGLASRLGAMFINGWFLPSSLIPATFGGIQHCFGATMAIHRELLQSIGGLDAIAENLADDFSLGKLVRDAGYEVRLSGAVLENQVDEPDIKTLILHELRWARTIRSVEPAGYLSTFLTDTLPIGVLLGVLMGFSDSMAGWAAWPPILALAAKTALQFSTSVTFSSKPRMSIWLLVVRDFLNFVVRVLSFAGHKVNWRDSQLSVNRGGVIDTPATNRLDDDFKKDSVPQSPVL